MTCPTHGATQEGLPCVWCWSHGPVYQRYGELPSNVPPHAAMTALFDVPIETFRLEKWRDKAHEWRYWLPA